MASSGLFDECGQATFRVKFNFEVDREIILGDQNYVVEVVAARAALHMARKAKLRWRAFALYLGNEMATELRPFRWESNVYAVEPMHVEGMPEHFFGKIKHVFDIETETKIYKAKYEMRMEFHNHRKRQPTEDMKPFSMKYPRAFSYDEKNPKCRRFANVFQQVRGELKNRNIKFKPKRNEKEKIVGPYGVDKRGPQFRVYKNYEQKSIGARVKFLEYVRKVNEANGKYGPPDLGQLADMYKVYQALNADLERLNVNSTENDDDEEEEQQPMEL